MKAKIKNNKDQKVFKPVQLELTIETIEEARLLFHCFNMEDLLEVLKKDQKRYEFGYYNADIAKEFPVPLMDIISDEIKLQGYEV